MIQLISLAAFFYELGSPPANRLRFGFKMPDYKKKLQHERKLADVRATMCVSNISDFLAVEYLTIIPLKSEPRTGPRQNTKSWFQGSPCPVLLEKLKFITYKFSWFFSLLSDSRILIFDRLYQGTTDIERVVTLTSTVYTLQESWFPVSIEASL